MPVKKKQKVDVPIENSVKVSVPGDHGSFSATAANYHFRDRAVDLKGAKSFKEVFQAVNDGTSHYGVIPMESSMSGSLQNTHDLLIQFKLFIVGEVAMQETHCLVAPKGVALDQIRKVYSHPHLLMQCNVFLDMDMEAKEGGQRICTDDSVAACKIVKESVGGDSAAIASEEAAKIFDLQVLKKDIGNYSPMITRYIVIAKGRRTNSNPKETKKTSICVSVSNAPGTLHRIVSCFGFRDIDIVRMEPRPSSTALDMFTGDSLKHWDYVYHIDFVPAVDAKTNKNLMNNLEEYCVVVRDFGTYPASVKRTDVAMNVILQSPLSKQARTSSAVGWQREHTSLYV